MAPLAGEPSSVTCTANVVCWLTTAVVGPSTLIATDWYIRVDADVGSTVTMVGAKNKIVSNKLIGAARFMPTRASLKYKRIIHLNFSILKLEDYSPFFCGLALINSFSIAPKAKFSDEK